MTFGIPRMALIVPRVGYDGRGLWRRLGRSLRRFASYLKTIGKPCRAETYSTIKVPVMKPTRYNLINTTFNTIRF